MVLAVVPWCLSWHKDTNFKANHNRFVTWFTFHIDVCLGTKIRILKQITTIMGTASVVVWCLSWHKDTNFKANHNLKKYLYLCISDVCLGTKIRILKQITTACCLCCFPMRCLSWHKDTNFKANHNTTMAIIRGTYDVCLGTKIRILKQITTKCYNNGKDKQMFVLAQRYEF